MKLDIEVLRDEAGLFMVICKQLPGVVSKGANLPQAMHSLGYSLSSLAAKVRAHSQQFVDVIQ